MRRAWAWLHERRETALVGAVALLLVLIGFGIGRGTAPAGPVRTVTEVKTVERIEWREKTETASAATATAEKKERVRVVTRWLRPDGTTAKEQVREASQTSSAQGSTSSTARSSSAGETARSSEHRTVVDLRPPARFHVQALLGLDLGAGLARRYGGSVAVRVVGPVFISAVAFPGAKLYGAGMGISF